MNSLVLSLNAHWFLLLRAVPQNWVCTQTALRLGLLLSYTGEKEGKVLPTWIAGDKRVLPTALSCSHPMERKEVRAVPHRDPAYPSMLGRSSALKRWAREVEQRAGWLDAAAQKRSAATKKRP